MAGARQISPRFGSLLCLSGLLTQRNNTFVTQGFVVAKNNTIIISAQRKIFAFLEEGRVGRGFFALSFLAPECEKLVFVRELFRSRKIKVFAKLAQCSNIFETIRYLSLLYSLIA